MVRIYKKKKSERNWTDMQLKCAIEKVNEGNPVQYCARNYGIPRTTLRRLLKTNVNKSSKKSGFQRTFNDEEELALYDLVIDMEKRLTGLSSKELSRLAFDFACKLKKTHHFDNETGLAGKAWLRSFMNRHQLSNKKAEPTSVARANGFNKEAVDRFFSLLEEVKQKYNFYASNIWNVDETGVSIVPKSSSKVIARRGRKQVGGQIAAERGETITAEICMSAAGSFMPLMLIFPRVKINDEYLQGKPPGSWAVWRKSGWMESDIFTEWFKKFMQFSNASVTNPVLLLLDGHITHVKNLEVAELGKDHGVTILCFPPHCTHRMQPLDVSFMKPLSTFYTEEVNSFQRTGVRIQMKDVFSLFGKAWQKAAKIETVVKAFQKTVIEPLNANVFDAELNVNDNNSNDLSSTIKKSTDPVPPVAEHRRTLNQMVMEVSECPFINEPHSDKNLDSYRKEELSPSANTSNTNVSEKFIKIPVSYILQAKPLISLLNSAITEEERLPLPNPLKRSRKRGKAMVVTSSEHINELLQKPVKRVKKEPESRKKSIPKIKSDILLQKRILKTQELNPLRPMQNLHKIAKK